MWPEPELKSKRVCKQWIGLTDVGSFLNAVREESGQILVQVHKIELNGLMLWNMQQFFCYQLL
jgi:hypothetical protein